MPGRDEVATGRRWPFRWALGLGIPAVVIVGGAVIWNWDWELDRIARQRR